MDCSFSATEHQLYNISSHSAGTVHFQPLNMDCITFSVTRLALSTSIHWTWPVQHFQSFSRDSSFSATEHGLYNISSHSAGTVHFHPLNLDCTTFSITQQWLLISSTIQHFQSLSTHRAFSSSCTRTVQVFLLIHFTAQFPSVHQALKCICATSSYGFHRISLYTATLVHQITSVLNMHV